MSKQLSSRSVQRHLRVSVRALMLLVMLSGGALWFERNARVQRAAVAAIEGAGGLVFYDCDSKTDRANAARRHLRWLAGRIGIDYFSNVVRVLLPDDLSDARLALLADLPRLERIDYDGSHSSVTDAGLACVARLTRLKELDLSDTNVTDAGLAHLSRMASLQELDLSGTRITDAGLVHLRGLRSLQTLSLSDTDVGQAGVAHLKTLTNLRSINLCGTKIDDFVAQELRRALPRAKVAFSSIMAFEKVWQP